MFEFFQCKHLNLGTVCSYRTIALQTLQKETSCRRRAIYPTIELAIFVIFVLNCSFFFLIVHIFIFNTSIASVGTHERIVKISLNF